MKWFKRVIKLVFLVAIILIALDLVLVFGLAHYRRDIPKADAVIVLGAAINTPALYNRTLEGLNLYREGKAEQLVLSGGKIANADISEAQYMEKVLQSQSTSDADLPKYVLEDQSHTTYENIHYSAEKIGHDAAIIVVSDQFHLARAVLLAKRQGFDEVYWSAPEPTHYSNDDLRFYYLRELVAMLTYIPKFISG